MSGLTTNLNSNTVCEESSQQYKARLKYLDANYEENITEYEDGIKTPEESELQSETLDNIFSEA